MKAHLTLAFALLLTCSGIAVAQTPDWMTPSEETICDSETGAAFGLCNAYCEAMDCESPNPQASESACTKVHDKFANITGHALPCETCPAPLPGTTCPCVGVLGEFDSVLNSSPGECFEVATTFIKITAVGSIAASCSASTPFGVFCGVETGPGVPDILSITPEEGQACVQLIREHCGPV